MNVRASSTGNQTTQEAPPIPGFLVLVRSATPMAVGRVFRLGSGECIVGRSGEAQLQIDDEGISRKHARVRCSADGRYWVEDLGSTNGTYVNGVLTQSAALDEGDRIELGSETMLRFSRHPALEPEESTRPHAASASSAQAAQLDPELLIASRLASVGTLAAGVAHEINNPLAFVSANVHYLSSGLGKLRGSNADPKALDELTQTANEARLGVERIARIVRDLKRFSQVDDADAGVGMIDPVPPLEFALQMVDNQLRHRAQLHRALQPLPAVRINPSRLSQVFVNLVMNAVQAIPEGRPAEHTITVRTLTGSSGEAVVEINDSGVGIPLENLPRIFDPFFTTRPVGTGVGLGLSVCHSIVNLAGGELVIESEPGKGTTARVRLPVAESQPALAAPPPAPLDPVEGGDPATAAPPSPRPRVLVVDDEPLVCVALQRILRSEFDVTTATGAEEALGWLRTGEFDVVLTDLMMPDTTGEELYERLITQVPALAQRVLFMTGGAFTEQARHFIDRIGRPVLSKPIEPEQVLRALRQLLDVPF